MEDTSSLDDRDPLEILEDYATGNGTAIELECTTEEFSEEDL